MRLALGLTYFLVALVGAGQTAVGVALLANVMSIVARSLPGPLQTYGDPLTLPNQFPHVWIATVCVAGAVAAHIIAVRALLGSPSRDTT